MHVGSGVGVQCHRFAVVALDMISIPLSFLTNKIWRFADGGGAGGGEASPTAPTTFKVIGDSNRTTIPIKIGTHCLVCVCMFNYLVIILTYLSSPGRKVADRY